MLKSILIGLVVILAAGAAIVAMQPDDYLVEQSVVINTEPDAIFPHINNPKKWDNWSPWANLDPNATITFNEIEAGKGASMAWDGNEEIGKGSLEIIESTPGKSLEYALRFERPMEGTSNAKFVLSPAEGGTQVSWSMYGKNDFISKAIWLVFCKRMMNKQLHEGLTNLKQFVEK